MPRYPPDRWFDYSSFGLPIKGTRILPVKLPIPEEKSAYIPIQQRFTFNDLFSRVRSLGQTISCVIDLTYTNYYNPGFLYRKGVRYYKILVEGHNVPHQKHVDEFARIVGLERQRSPSEHTIIDYNRLALVEPDLSFYISLSSVFCYLYFKMFVFCIKLTFSTLYAVQSLCWQHFRSRRKGLGFGLSCP
ncbi:RNA:RNP complex 1 interacting phosphatase [Paragonimus heterotremus]|uniref:RNA:RNP complex 1 interacting phosphatase n=1 Tax=Paragonimus heterotremus TaxID=100268 RepID=A0A8J4WCI5_9TREM|nr:RNA:RNP complex 1 interacting phosphatase [Paragonimus heterotremus]